MFNDIMNKNFKNIRTAVIGVGSMGQNHARIYSEISDLVAVIDPNESQGQEVARRCSTKWLKNHEELKNQVDAVSIAVPTKFHFDIAMDLAEAGVNILVEKPMASNVKEAEKIIEASSRSDSILSVGHIERHNPVVEFAKKHILNNSWGDVLSISAKRMSPHPGRISDVGVILDLSVHDIDVINFLYGLYPKTIYCTGSLYGKNGNEEQVIIVLNYGDGKIGICETSWHSPVKIRRLAVTSSTIHAKINFMNQSINLSKSDRLSFTEGNLFKQKIEVDNQDIRLPHEEPLRNQLIDFLNSVVTSSSPLVSGSDGSSVLKIANAALDSLKSNKVIKL
tara:strand:+ start:3740 stop:4747 length:1008 start_codon:yes stop_codon:yes gene_type:complete